MAATRRSGYRRQAGPRGWEGYPSATGQGRARVATCRLRHCGVRSTCARTTPRPATSPHPLRPSRKPPHANLCRSTGPDRQLRLEAHSLRRSRCGCRCAVARIFHILPIFAVTMVSRNVTKRSKVVPPRKGFVGSSEIRPGELAGGQDHS